MSDCKCMPPCNPCDKCPDDGVIISSEILDPEDCNTGCCWKKCNDNCWINIQSTKPDCLRVDTTECWVVKLDPVCPPVVTAWSNIIVDVEECSEPNCSLNYIVSANCEDEKVKACGWDTTPGYLDEKLEAWWGINIDSIGCDWNHNSKLKISVDEDILPDYEYPELQVYNTSKLIQTTYGWPNWHTIWISDKETTSYNNNVCVWFETNKDVRVTLDWGGNAMDIEWVSSHDNWWTVFTGNKDMATHAWIKILESGYYRVFWQLTIQNNIREYADPNEYFLNLWRAFLRVMRWSQSILMSTAKHWAYWRQVLLTWGTWIEVTANWDISYRWGYVDTTSESTNEPVYSYSWWGTQSAAWFDWPWMTFNIDAYVDLWKNDVITLWYRPQSDMPRGINKSAYFRFVWRDDQSTHWDVVFWGTVMWVQQIAPRLFQSDSANQIYDYISQ